MKPTKYKKQITFIRQNNYISGCTKTALERRQNLSKIEEISVNNATLLLTRGITGKIGKSLYHHKIRTSLQNRTEQL